MKKIVKLEVEEIKYTVAETMDYLIETTDRIISCLEGLSKNQAELVERVKQLCENKEVSNVQKD